MASVADRGGLIGHIPRGWSFERRRSSAAAHHGRPLPDEPVRSIWLQEIDRPALVLGSTQDEDVIDRAAATALGVEVVRRHSGGGVVLLVPGDFVWLDVILPVGDPLWEDDVGRASRWLGGAWLAALTDIGVGGAAVHEAALTASPLGRLVCFGAVAPGEVIHGVRKVVGISQRRTRHAARFQCVLYRTWEASILARLLRLDEENQALLHATVLEVRSSTDDIVAAFLAHLP